MPGATSSFLLLVVRTGATSSFLFLVVRPEATSSFLLLVVTLGATSSFLILVGVPGAATVHGRKIQTLLPENSKLVSLPECFDEWTKQIKHWQHKFNETSCSTLTFGGRGLVTVIDGFGFEYLVHPLCSARYVRGRTGAPRFGSRPFSLRTRCDARIDSMELTGATKG